MVKRVDKSSRDYLANCLLYLFPTGFSLTDWFGYPIPFGEQVRFVCQRGYFFEEDPSQIDVTYTCQDGSNEEYKDMKGFFDIPKMEEDWPRCLLGEKY